MHHAPRRWMGFALVAGSALALSACASSPTTDTVESASSTETEPIIVEHAYGTLELDEAPHRVVTLGMLETDVAVALGVTPVAMAMFFASDDGISPWLASELDDVPTIIDTTTTGADGASLALETIASLEPDLIIANTYSQLESYYDQLSQIAPVLGPAEAEYLELPWRDQTMAIAEALGKTEQAETMITDTETQLAEATEQYDVTAGHDYTLSLGTTDQLKVINSPDDASVEIMNAFGLTYSEVAAALPSLDDGSGSSGVSEETVAGVDADIVLIAYAGEAAQTRWETSTLFQGLSAVVDGGYVPMELADNTALRNPSPLSIPYVIEHVIADKIAPALED